ncbi:MAG: amino acid ABC transporter substrate-binding protein [Proteobacteria bacterium]|nr:amino acid ABC transporter substrate-binding protein [Pseudomonadota bacterium]
MKRRMLTLWVLAIIVITTWAVAARAGETLDTVKGRGHVLAGVNEGLFGFSMPDKKGVWQGLDVDTGRAVAAAIFGDAGKVRFVPLTAKGRFDALRSKKIDLLCRNTTRTLSRETAEGLNFAPVNFYDGQGFMVHRKSGLERAGQLDGLRICVLGGTTTEMNATDYFRRRNMKFTPVVFESTLKLNEAFFSGKCDCLTSDASQLAGARAVAPQPSDYVILPDVISKEPLAPAVDQGDDAWFEVVRWTVFALIQAEEFGIDSKNVNEALKSQDPAVQRFLGLKPGLGAALGLSEGWVVQVVGQVGNYGEIFERNVGRKTPLGLPRGLNALWTEGGLMYSPPFR